jgi:hypothetical protein
VKRRSGYLLPERFRRALRVLKLTASFVLNIKAAKYGIATVLPVCYSLVDSRQ